MLTNFVIGLVALSVGVERIVEILKNIFPWLKAHDARPPLLAVACGTAVALSVGPHALLPFLPPGVVATYAGAALLGVLASGGSAFWNRILDVLDAVKTVKQGTPAATLESSEIRRAA